MSEEKRAEDRPCARCGHPKDDHADTDQKFCLIREPGVGARCRCERWIEDDTAKLRKMAGIEPTRSSPSQPPVEQERFDADDWNDIFATALRPFALAYEDRVDPIGPEPPVAVQVAGQTHGGDPWKVAADVLDAYEAAEPPAEGKRILVFAAPPDPSEPAPRTCPSQPPVEQGELEGMPSERKIKKRLKAYLKDDMSEANYGGLFGVSHNGWWGSNDAVRGALRRRFIQADLADAPPDPSEPAPRTCPTCGSDDPEKDKIGSNLYPRAGITLTSIPFCPDPFHTPSPEVTEQPPERVNDDRCGRCGHIRSSHDPECFAVEFTERGTYSCQCQGFIEQPRAEGQTHEGAIVGRQVMADPGSPLAADPASEVEQPPERSIEDIRATGAAWVTEAELAHLCEAASEVAEQPPNLDEKCERCDHSRGHHVPGCVKCHSLGLPSCLAFDEPTSSEVAVEAGEQIERFMKEDYPAGEVVRYGDHRSKLAEAEATVLDALMRLAQQKVSTEKAEAALARSESQRKQVERERDELEEAIRSALAGEGNLVGKLRFALSSDAGKEES